MARGIHITILQKGIAADGSKDLGFTLPGKPYAFGITAAFKIENTLRVPSMLVITDQLALRVSSKCCFSSP